MKKQRCVADSNGNPVSIPRGIHQPEEILKTTPAGIWAGYPLAPEHRLAVPLPSALCQSGDV